MQKKIEAKEEAEKDLKKILADVTNVEDLDAAYKTVKRAVEANLRSSEENTRRNKKRMITNGCLSAAFATFSVVDFTATGGMMNYFLGGLMVTVSVSNAVDVKNNYKDLKKSKENVQANSEFIELLDKAYAERKSTILNPPPPPPPDALIKLLTSGNAFDDAAQKQEPGAAEPKKSKKPKSPEGP